jgi:aspartate/methionine/tyrosine aminotransferase
MKNDTRMMGSSYIQWAKTSAELAYNLAPSGLFPYLLRDLNVTIEDVEITGPSAYGYEPLQKELATKSQVPVECVVAAAGTTMANHLAMAAILKPGDEVLIEHPVYEPLLAIASFLGAKTKRFARRFENSFRIEPEEIERHMTPQTRLIATTNLHNPSGVLTGEKTLRAIQQIAKTHGARILVDEVYLETLFTPTGIRSAFHLGSEFVVTSSLTKAYGLSGLRCGWILAEPDLAKRMWHLYDLFVGILAHPAERLSVIALQKLPQIAHRAKTILDTNRQLLERFFDEQNGLEVVMPEAGTIAFPRLKSGNADQFCTLLAEKYETGVVPGSFFEMPDHFRIGIACPTDMLAEGLKRIGAALKHQ